MDTQKFLKSTLMTLAASVVITAIFWFALSLIPVAYLPFLALVFGIYMFAVFGTNRLVDDNIIEDGGFRKRLAVVFAVIFIVVFCLIMPVIFGPDVFLNAGI